MNFSETLDIVREKRYADRIIDRIPYTNPKTAKQMEIVGEMLAEYIGKRI